MQPSTNHGQPVWLRIAIVLASLCVLIAPARQNAGSLKYIAATLPLTQNSLDLALPTLI